MGQDNVCSLILDGEIKLTLVSLSLFELHENKPPEIHEHVNLFLTHSEPVLGVQDEHKGPPLSHPLPTSMLKHAKVFSKVGLKKIAF